MLITHSLAIVDLIKYFEPVLLCFGGLFIILIMIFVYVSIMWQSTAHLPFKSIAEFRRRLINEDLVPEEELLGCTEAEIQQIMGSQNVQDLPLFYKEFLKVAGKGSGEVKIWTVYYYPDILSIETIVDEALLNQVPENAFIFGYAEHARSSEGRTGDEIVVDKVLSFFLLDKRYSARVIAMDNSDFEPQVVYPTFLHFLADYYLFLRNASTPVED